MTSLHRNIPRGTQMFKLTRNNAGDARDVAALRAAVFDELTGLWNKSASEVAEDSLKLGGRDAALYALLTDLDTLKSTYFSGTSAKAALTLATARKINNVSFNGSADITLGLVPCLAGPGVSIKTLIQNNHNRINFASNIGAVDTPEGSGASVYSWTYEVMAWDTVATSFTVLARRHQTGDIRVASCGNGTWTGWWQITDAAGRALLSLGAYDEQSGRTIKVKSGNVFATGPGTVTFASAFPHGLLGAIYHPSAGGACLIATGNAGGISMTSGTSGLYDWIAWGY